MQFDSRAVRESLPDARDQPLGLGFLALPQHTRERPRAAAGEQDQPGGMCGDRVEGKLRLEARISVQKAARRQAPQVVEAEGVLCQQHDRLRRQARIIGAGQRDLAADDRLDALGRAGLAELQRAEQVGSVRDRHRRHVRLERQGRDLLGLDRALAQRVGGMDAQMDEIGVRHASGM